MTAPAPETLTTLADAIITELSNSRLANRTHGLRTTYDSGCRGPLCRKANRDRMRVVKKGIPQKRFHGTEEMLEKLIAEHKAQRQLQIAI